MKKRLSFTAVELVLVITIAAILLSISLPAFYNLSSGRRVTAALTAISANISLARAQAVSGNTYTALIFSPSGDSMRIAVIHKQQSNGVAAFTFNNWLDDSTWEAIEEGVVILSGSDNFHEGTSTTPYPVGSVDFSEVGGDSAASAARAIIFNKRGQIVTVGAPTDTFVIRVAEGTKPPGATEYTPKKTDNKVSYGRLTVNPLSCRTVVDYVNE